MLDPAVLATLSSAVTFLGTELLKGTAGEAGKATWGKIKSLLGWSQDPAPADLPTAVTAALTASPHLAEELTQLLKQSNTSASQLVGSISAENGKINVVGNVTATTVNF